MNHNSILIIDDDRDIRDVIAIALESEGFNVHTVESARDGLSWLRSHQKDLPQLIILDLMMPEMDGRAFLGELQKETIPEMENVPIFLSSATTNLSTDGLPITGVLTKPMELQNLIDVAKKYCV